MCIPTPLLNDKWRCFHIDFRGAGIISKPWQIILFSQEHIDMFQQKVPWALWQFNKQRFFHGLLHHGRFGGFRWGWFGARRKWRGRRIYATDLCRLLYRQKRTYWGGGNMSEVAEFCQIQGYTVTEFKSHVTPFSLETWSRHGIEICSLPDMAKDAECPKTQWLDFKTGLWQLEFLLPFLPRILNRSGILWAATLLCHLVKPYAGMMFLSLLQVAANFWNWRGITELDRKYIYLAILCDLFQMVMWPFEMVKWK